LKGKIEKKNQFNKRLKKTIKIMIKLKKKRYLENWDWMMKLKTNKTCTKGPTIKIGEERKKEKKIGLLATN